MMAPEPRAMRRTQRRADLVAAAVVAVRRHGAGVSVAEIAATAGITKPIIYRNFADRADLQRAVGELAASVLVQRIGEQMQRDLGPAERVREMINAFLTCIDEDPELWRFVVHHPAGVVDDTRQQIVRMLTGLIGAELGHDTHHDTHHDTDGAEVWAHGLVGMVQSTAEWWLERRTMSRDALADHLTALAWGGLAAADLPSLERSSSRASEPTPRGTP